MQTAQQKESRDQKPALGPPTVVKPQRMGRENSSGKAQEAATAPDSENERGLGDEDSRRTLPQSNQGINIRPLREGDRPIVFPPLCPKSGL